VRGRALGGLGRCCQLGPPRCRRWARTGGSLLTAPLLSPPAPPPLPSPLQISYQDCNGVIPQETYDKACIFSLEEAIESCAKIGCAARALLGRAFLGLLLLARCAPLCGRGT
jgi:hypothetical protein